MEAFVQAAVNGINPTVTAFLKKYPAAIDEKMNGWTALMMTAVWDQEELAKLLLDRGAETDEKCSDGRTALVLARDWQHDEVATLLAEAAKRRVDEAAARVAEEERIRVVSDPHLRRDMPVPKLFTPRKNAS